MTVDFSILNNGKGRSIVGVGQVFSTSGHYIKCAFPLPSNGILADNLRALIYQEQSIYFAEIEGLDGFLFEKENAEYFPLSAIHFGANFDPNARAIWLDFKDQQIEGTDSPRVIVPITIYVSSGKGDPELQIRRNSGYTRALINLLSIVPNQFFVVGWPKNLDSEIARQRCQPECKIQFKYGANPDVSGVQGSASRPVGILQFALEMTAKQNT